MIKLKGLLKESVNESMDDLVIKRGLELSLKDAGFKVKKFKKAKPGYNEIWAGVFHTKNAVMAFSYSKYGDVFYSGKNIGKLNSKGLLNWLKDIKRQNKWTESVNEAPEHDLSRDLNKVSDNIIKITNKYKKKADVDGMVRSWMMGLHARLKKSVIKIK